MKTTALVVLLAALAPVAAAAAPLDAAGMQQALKIVDDRQRSTGDYKSLAYVLDKAKDKQDVVYEVVVYRRDADQKLIILFLKPKASEGQGYLRLDENLWFYDPSVGHWERRTERERIGGTNSRREDFDQSHLSDHYTAQFIGEDKLGAFTTWHLKLALKPDADEAFPIVELWVDEANGNMLKRQEFALSGKLMRTVYYPKWEKLYSESKKADVWYAKEMRIYDEIEKANSTVIEIKDVDLRSLDANLFTKAWVESKSR
jgi:hypothetical protein